MTEIAHDLANLYATPRRGRSSVPAAVSAFLVGLFDTVLTWRDRSRERHQLLTLDDRLLADIGIDRADAVQEAKKPFWRP